MNEIKKALSEFDTSEMDDLTLSEVMVALVGKMTEVVKEITCRNATAWQNRKDMKTLSEVQCTPWVERQLNPLKLNP